MTMRDVFYFGKKPNAHPREKFAIDLADARVQCTTEHFWIINEYCDYRNFDWDFDFEFLPDEDVWVEDHINVWPSFHQKDSGTWLCNTDNTHPLIVYRADVDPVKRKNEKTSEWVTFDLVDEVNFDFSWHPDPTDPPYIYVWGNKYVDGRLKPTLEYHCPSATDKKYMADVVPILPEWDRWVILHEIDKSSFDFSWRPDPREPAFIYVFGNNQYEAELMPTIEYHMPNASERKYLHDMKARLASIPSKFEHLEDAEGLDYSWVPNPKDPPYIYTWGNQWNKPEDKISIQYVVSGASEYKYMEQRASRKPCMTNWEVPDGIDVTAFDFSWEPSPADPPYIYQFGTQHQKTGGPRYVTPGADSDTPIKYVDLLKATRLPNKQHFTVLGDYKIKDFDWSWHPDETEEPYIYVFGNTLYPVEAMPTVEYAVPGASQVKYISDIVAVLGTDMTNWVVPMNIDATAFDFSWRPDPNEPPYIYQFGTQHQKTGGPRYVTPGATEVKYVDVKARALAQPHMFTIIDGIVVDYFDYSWHPDDTEEPYIYVFGNNLYPGTVMPTVGYVMQGATQFKYVSDIVATLGVDMKNWKVNDSIDMESFDFSWRPNPTDPPYVYQWGNKHYSSMLKPTVEYIVPDATEVKHMAQDVKLLPTVNWVEHCAIDKNKFDYTWRPDPTSPPYIYVWGNKHIPGELKPTIEYHCPNATEKKYMGDDVVVLPELDRWKEYQSIDKTKFDLTWRPDPREPAYIYVWGNKHIPGELKSTIEYHYPGATEKKYMGDVEVEPEIERWKITQEVLDFDLTWRPDPREPAYIYVWGNKHIPGELKPTIEYYCPGATEKKYMGEVEVIPEWDRWVETQPVDREQFDLTWRPDPREPAYIYVWGNKHISGELKPTIEYRCPGATEKKYMQEPAAVLPLSENWVINQATENFDYTWRPDPREPAYIYVWGNKWIPAELKSTVEYHVPGATEKKYMGVVDVAPEWERYKMLIPIGKEGFDFSWRPDPREPAYIYVWGNQWNDATTEPTLEYHCPGATQRKYMTDVVANVKSTSTDSAWKRLIAIESFDYSWRPNPKAPAYIYVFGNKWNDAATEPSVEYHVPGATEYKYVTDIVAIPKADMSLWAVSNVDDLETFDFTWRPNPHSPPQIYQWRDNGPRYTAPDASEVVLMERLEGIKVNVVRRYKIKTTLEDLINEHRDEVFWALNPDLSYDKFDFSWRPSEENFRHVNVFGNEYSKNTQTYYVNAPLYLMGYTEMNYVEEQVVKTETNLSMFFIDRGNSDSASRFNALKEKYPRLQKTRYLNSWVDTINRCINKSDTKLFWVLNSELDYSDFEFDFYPSPWQMKMVHVFGTQWSHWGNTYMINKETFSEDTKYVKIIEHLSVLNFVKSKRAKAVDRIYDEIVINHGNMTDEEKKGKYVVDHDTSYLNTFRTIVKQLPEKKEHYIWITSSVCDYSNFDFSYICDPFAKDQLHVFPSDKQKFGDTFLVDVNKLRSLIDDMLMLEDYEKINYNQHQRVKRLDPPTIITDDDTHTKAIFTDFNFPYAIFKTVDNKDLDTVDTEPMNLWDKNTKNIIVTSTGGTRIIVPKEAKNYVEEELYDYPYISRGNKLAQSKPLDIVFLSNGEKGSDENYEHLLKVTRGTRNRVVRVTGVNGRVAAYHAAANASETPWVFTVFAKLKVSDTFDWNWQPDRLQVPKHYIFNAVNPVNGLVYGHQAMIAYNKKLTLSNPGVGLDFTLDSQHETVDAESGVALFNTDEWSTWRTAFREVIKLRLDNSSVSRVRMDTWLSKAEGDFAEYSLRGAADGLSYFEEVAGDLEKLRLSYEWDWLRNRFNTRVDK